MSVEYIASAFEQVGLSVSQKFTLVVLANFADEEGYAYPSISKLMAITCLSKQGVIDAIQALENHGMITRVGIEHIPSHYLKKRNQNCYHLEIIPVRLVNSLDRSTHLTSQPTLPVNSVDLNRQLILSQPQETKEEKDIYKYISQKKKIKNTPTEKTFELSEELIEWGFNQPQKWTKEEMQIHFEFFENFRANMVRKPYKDLTRAFKNCVIGNWAKIQRERRLKTYSDQVAENNDRAFNNVIKLIEQGDFYGIEDNS